MSSSSDLYCWECGKRLPERRKKWCSDTCQEGREKRLRKNKTKDMRKRMFAHYNEMLQCGQMSFERCVKEINMLI